VVVCAQLANIVDINQLEHEYHGLCYQQPAFPALCLKDDVSTLCQIFRNGKVVVIGGKSEDGAKCIFDEYLSRVAELGYDTSYHNYKIQNIVARYDVHKQIKLTKLAKKKDVTYEPEIFPSAVKFRMKDIKVTANIFYSGKIMILSAKSMSDLETAVERVTCLIDNG